ncbi:endopolygalacturonase [Leifsonia xyli subsp. cynodontis DSM 46306]|uniref:Polygalacturonase n=1 Tax=Leifsonia xyli subsp. cynodontis DSM 46306 TaxID=1389489 RepID=U3PAV6_LEIXC|nr:endopolygalacturonase [Leifsonia xyli subsp. cynodontis DSM 46306]
MVLSGMFLSLALIGSVGVAGEGSSSASAASPSSSTVLGDRREVVEPTAPTTTCMSLTARLTMIDRLATASQETSPPDTARIQSALDDCAQNGTSVVAVRLTASDSGTSFLSGPLSLRRGEILLLDPAVTLYASRDPAAYQIAKHSTCGTIAGNGNGCKPFVSIAEPHAGIESAQTSSGAQGRIDGRGDLPMLGQSLSWWQLSKNAKTGGMQNVPRLIQAAHADDVTLHDVDLLDSPGFHVSYKDGDGLTVWGVRIQTPATARNTDGIDPAGATDVTIADSWIMDGDDGIAIKAGSGPSAHITITHDRFSGTHGISIGSETVSGVSDVLVADDTVSGADAFGNTSESAAGIRIKSSRKTGGTVHDIVYRDICVDHVKAPIVFDTHYGDRTGHATPWFTGIVVDGLRATNSSAKAVDTMEGIDSAHPLGLTLRRVDVDAPGLIMGFAEITTAGASFGGAPLTSTKPDVRVKTTPDADAPPSCALRDLESPPARDPRLWLPDHQHHDGHQQQAGDARAGRDRRVRRRLAAADRRGGPAHGGNDQEQGEHQRDGVQDDRPQNPRRRDAQLVLLVGEAHHAEPEEHDEQRQQRDQVRGLREHLDLPGVPRPDGAHGGHRKDRHRPDDEDGGHDMQHSEERFHATQPTERVSG